MEHLGLIFLITVIFYSAVAAFAIAKKDSNKPKLFYYSGFVWFIIIFCIAKFLPEKATGAVNFVPFAALFSKEGGSNLVEFILSAAMFLPFGFLLSIYGTRKKEEYLFVKLLLFVLIVSVASELLQLFPLGKTVSLDHIIANTVGACIGFLIFIILSKSDRFKGIVKKI